MDSSFNLGLFGGLAGFCFTTHYLSRNGTRYRQLLRTLEAELFQRCAESTSQAMQMPDDIGCSDFDLITGSTGIGAYLLLRQTEPSAVKLLDMIVGQLSYFSHQKNDRLGFFIKPQRLATDKHREQYPDGCIDCGLAHGVPGPLSLLALAQLRNDIEKQSICEPIRHLSDWLVLQCFTDNWGINWPYAAPPASLAPKFNTRAAWCYGSPGIARALWLAGAALGDSGLKDIAVEAMQAVYRRPIAERRINYSGPGKLDTKTGVAKVHSGHEKESHPQSLHA